MHKRVLLIAIFMVALFSSAQTLQRLDSEIEPVLTNSIQNGFDRAYAAFPTIPTGILEAVAYAQTRIRHISGNNESCTGIPQVKGVMGLTEDGKGYFKNNLIYVSTISGISIQNIKTNPTDNIMAYAAAYANLISTTHTAKDDFKGQDQILKTLSEIPWDGHSSNNYALSCFTYEVFQFLNSPSNQVKYNFENRTIDLEKIYGINNLKILKGDIVTISSGRVIDSDGLEFKTGDRSAEYGPAIWDATPSCNYSSRFGVDISAVTIHTIQGSYAGAISWAKNCDSHVSYHYVARSSDGQITQMVLEEDKAWHVGSENPYTIGIEHEGYVDDPVWYTEAMYVGSADLVRDITESGYGINPLRTFHGPATSGTLTLGSCRQIKGHQHFPGASHTDPGINWNWVHYYDLINDDPDWTNYTAESGTFFDSGGEFGNYADDERSLYLIQPAGATVITLNILSFSIEEDWDYLAIYDGEDLDATLVEEYTGTDIPAIITLSSGSALLEFRSDCGTNQAGWEISWTSEIADGFGDEIAPETEVVLEEDWYTDDFTTLFIDTDDSLGAGVKYQFYQVIDYNGVEWRANNNNGFFSDNFDAAIHADWTTLTGTWEISDEVVKQNDEVSTNTNMYASLNQEEYNRYFYHWSGKISGAGTDKRAGLHIMCDDATLTNRGNSYFVWFREDGNKVQIYKTVEDVFTVVAAQDYSFSADIWYDIKTVYDKTTGEIHIWINNIHVLSWMDDSPLISGNAISFRTGNAIYEINDFKVYHDRGEESVVTVGVSGDARYQNADPFTPAAKVKSLIIDSAYNISSISAEFVDVDWTAPLPLTYINDGVGADISTTTSNTELAANWSTTFDPNSGIARYWYAIGTTPGAIDIVGWTDNWYADTIVHTGLSLTLGETFYFSVTAENGAGLLSDTIISDGQLLIEPTAPPEASFIPDHTNFCGIDSVQFENGSSDALTYEWFIPDGTPSYSTETNPYIHFDASGTFSVRLIATGPGGADTLDDNIIIELSEPPVANFIPSSIIVPLSDPLVTFDNISTNADGYYWDFDDGNFSTDEDPYHSFDGIGIYIVSLIAINSSCPNDTISRNITVTEFDKILERNSIRIEIFPNPANDYIQIVATELSNAIVVFQIYDVHGKLVKEIKQLNLKSENKIWIADFAQGIYQIKITGSDWVVIQKIMVRN